MTLKETIKIHLYFPFAKYSEHKLNTNQAAAPGALTHRLQHHIACKIKMAARGHKNGCLGLERRQPLGFWALPSTFVK